jgi:hypothetical protein
MSGLGFSAPWLLLAAAALAGPIAAHLARHEDREGRAFPSLMFLRRVPFPTRSRRTLSDRVLLALRLLALLFFVLSFAQPYLLVDVAQAAATQGARVVLLDRSFSMGAGTRFARARELAQTALRVDDDGTRVALVVFDASPLTLSDFAAGPGAALQALRAARVATDLNKALSHAARLLSSAAAAKRELILISDLQASGVGAGLELANDIELRVQRIDDDVPNNLALLGAWYDEREGAEDGAISLHVRVANTGSEPLSSPLRVLVNGLHAAQQQVNLAAGARSDLLVPVFAAREQPTRVELLLDDDALVIDNTRVLLIAPMRPIKVLWVADSARGNAYVNAALSPEAEPLPGQSPEQQKARPRAGLLHLRGVTVEVQNVGVNAIEARQIDEADVIVLDSVIPKAVQFTAAIERRVAQGGGLLTVLAAGSQDTAQVDGSLAAVVAGVPGAPRGTAINVDAGLTAAGVGSAAGTALAALAPEHAIAAALGESTLSGIAVWHFQALERRTDEQVLARFENGLPALLERAHGLGRSMTLALSLQPRASDLVLDPVFVPLLSEALRHLSQRSAARLQYAAGDVLDVARYADAVVGGDAIAQALRARGALHLRTPGGAAQNLVAAESPLLAETGFYELRVANEAPLPIAVNAASAESLLDALSVAQFETRLRRGDGRADAVVSSDAATWRDTRIANWLLWLAIAALLAEALTAAWLAHRRGPRQVAA